MSPPKAFRDPDRVVYAGRDDTAKVPLQAPDSTEALLDPPVAVPDPYGWLRDSTRKDSKVLEHLKAENEFTSQMTDHLEGLRSTLYDELLRGVTETDATPAWPDGPHVVYRRTLAGQAYPIYCRAPRDAQRIWQDDWDDAQKAASPVYQGEEILLDVNVLAKDRTYCSVGSVKTSADHGLLAYTVDFTGDEQCELKIQDLKTNTLVFDSGPEELIYGSIRWGKDQSTLFYLALDEAQRPYRLYRRRFDDSMKVQGEDEMLLEEPDTTYWVGMYKSLDDRYLFVETSSKTSSEIYYLDLEDPAAALQCIAKRRSNVLYEVEHRNGSWWIASNVGERPNLALYTATVGAGPEDWKLVTDGTGQHLFDGNAQLCLDGVSCFQQHVVASGREGGLPRIWILRNVDGDAPSMERLSFPEAAHDCGVSTHYEYNTDTLHVSYDSLVTPTQSLRIHMDDTTQRTVVKKKVVPGYDPDDYACERLMVLSRDGSTQIPVSMVYKKGAIDNKETPKPVHLYGYGSYGSCLEADFVASRLPLLNRGIVYVLAHVRGGGEMGRTWYEMPNGAKFLCKRNTFYDFCDIAAWLVHDRRLTTPDLLSCEGRSAGGMLIAASINEAPELFRVAVLGVPFVDVVPTMIDASIPLTAVEWEEWGCPNEKKYFSYMMEYNPITNVKSAKYPACLLTGGLHDPRVPFWEPAKLAAELRHTCTPRTDRPVCLKMDMGAGHFSASDRYKYLREKAFDFAFLLDQLGLAQSRGD